MGKDRTLITIIIALYSGLGLDWSKGTYVVCPQCKKEVGVAKLM